MKQISIVLVLLGIAVGLTGCGPAQTSMSAPAAQQFTVAELTWDGCLPAIRSKRGGCSTHSLPPVRMRSRTLRESVPIREQAVALQATYAVSGLATFVNGQGREAGRSMFAGAVARALQKPASPEHAAFLMTQLRTAGRAESLEPLSHFLGDERLCEPATQAMLAIGGDAGNFFLAALPAVTGEAASDDHQCSRRDPHRWQRPARSSKNPAMNPQSRSSAALTALAAIGDANGEEALRAVLTAPVGYTADRNPPVAGVRRPSCSPQATCLLPTASQRMCWPLPPLRKKDPFVLQPLDLLVRVNGERGTGQSVHRRLRIRPLRFRAGFWEQRRYLPGSAVTRTLGGSARSGSCLRRECASSSCWVSGAMCRLSVPSLRRSMIMMVLCVRLRSMPR